MNPKGDEAMFELAWATETLAAIIKGEPNWDELTAAKGPVRLVGDVVVVLRALIGGLIRECR